VAAPSPHDTVAVQSTGALADDRPERSAAAGPPPLIFAIASALAVLVANLSGIATGDDGVGYRAMADSLLRGDGYGYFLEDPVTVWPPIWPGLMATVAKLTPLDTMGAVILLNVAVAFAVVLVGNRLLRKVVDDPRLILLGTAVFALGPSTVGLGHVLMTDMAFALVVMVWMLVLFHFHETGRLTSLVAAGVWAWFGFGLRYVGLVLIAFGGLWVLLDRRRSVLERIRNGAIYGLVSMAVPAAWMLRNHSIDGSFTGERHPSARGLVDNLFDVAATLGRFLLPGFGNGYTKIWAAIGIVVLALASYVAWRILRIPPARDGAAGQEPLGPGAVLGRVVGQLGEPLGLLLLVPTLYMTYMVYVRTTTALNQLDLRLLYPAYFPLLVLGLALVQRSRRLADGPPADARWWRLGWGGAHVWAVANVVAGLVAMVAFAAGHPYFSGNYEADVFQEVRANPALEALPADCQPYSNLPNALYPRLGSLWSPQRRALESSEEIPDLEEIIATLDDTPSCLVWIDEPPVWGHLWTLEQLQDRLELTQLAHDDNVTVFRMEQRD
jgi:hypothetical protein